MLEEKKDITKITLYLLDNKTEELTRVQGSNGVDEISKFQNEIGKKTGLVASFFRLDKNPTKAEFEDEIEVNRRVNTIYGTNVAIFTAAAPLIYKYKDYNNANKVNYPEKQVLGMIVEISGESPLYITFSTACEQIISKNKLLSNFNLENYIGNILDSLIVLQGKGYEHNDIKLDNTVSCDSFYKLIDWGQCAKINEKYNSFRGEQPKIGARISTSPMRWFLSGRAVASWKLVARELIQYMATDVKRFEYLAGWEPFILTTNRIKEEFDAKINWAYTRNSYRKLFVDYKNTFDVFMLGMTILHACYLLGPQRDNAYHKYKPIIDNFTSISNPIKEGPTKAKEIFDNDRANRKNRVAGRDYSLNTSPVPNELPLEVIKHIQKVIATEPNSKVLQSSLLSLPIKHNL